MLLITRHPDIDDGCGTICRRPMIACVAKLAARVLPLLRQR
jgi:hypothetical protein